jgi:hypothetical protein
VTDLPIVCELRPEELSGRVPVLRGLLARAEAREAVDGTARGAAPAAEGYRYRYGPAPGLLAELAGAIEVERGCCRFLRFALTVEPGGGPFLLEVTGPAGTRGFLDQMLAG